METLTTKNGLPAFFGSLNSVQTDRFVRVMGNLESRGAQGALFELESELRDVKNGIDEVNKKRDSLRIQMQDFAAIIADLDDTPNNRSRSDLVQLRYMLSQRVSELGDQIASSRPVRLHGEKARIKKDIANRRLLADLAGMLRTTAANNHGD